MIRAVDGAGGGTSGPPSSAVRTERLFRPRSATCAWGGFLYALVLVLSACDESVDPIQDTDLAFSIHGYLDPASDTQWVRVAPLRPLRINTSDPVDATVEVEDIKTGRTVPLIPTLFTQRSGNFDDTLFAYNFRTEEPIDPGATYRLSARRSDGRSTSATVLIPSGLTHIAAIVGIAMPRFPQKSDFVRFPVAAGDHVAMVNTLLFAPDALGDPPVATDWCLLRYPPRTLYNELPGTPITGDGFYQVEIARSVVGDFPPPCGGGGAWGIRIVRSREPWFLGTGTANLHLSARTNIENGVGFFGGVMTRTVPYDSCTLSGPGAPDFCELYYGPETVTLFVVPVNRWEDLISPDAFRPRASLKRVDESWQRGGMRHPYWDTESRVTRFPGLLSGTFRLRVEVGAFCEDRIIALQPGETRAIVVEMGPLDPGEEYNSDRCRERVA